MLFIVCRGPAAQTGRRANHASRNYARAQFLHVRKVVPGSILSRRRYDSPRPADGLGRAQRDA